MGRQRLSDLPVLASLSGADKLLVQPSGSLLAGSTPLTDLAAGVMANAASLAYDTWVWNGIENNSLTLLYAARASCTLSARANSPVILLASATATATRGASINDFWQVDLQLYDSTNAVSIATGWVTYGNSRDAIECTGGGSSILVAVHTPTADSSITYQTRLKRAAQSSSGGAYRAGIVALQLRI